MKRHCSLLFGSDEVLQLSPYSPPTWRRRLTSQFGVSLLPSHLATTRAGKVMILSQPIIIPGINLSLVATKYPGSGYYPTIIYRTFLRVASAITEERYQQLVDYLRGARYPPGFTINAKRELRQQAAMFGRCPLPCIKRQKWGKPVPLKQIRLIQACHDGIDGGHFGRDKTLSKVVWDQCSLHSV